MEYVQEAITTLHALEDPPAVGGLEATLDHTAVVVPMTHHEREGEAATRTLETLAALDPAAVVLPIRAPPGQAEAFAAWLEGFDLPLEPLWCSTPGVDTLLDEHGITTAGGKGRDVWLALGPAMERADHVVVHDADALNYDDRIVRRLLAPLAMGYQFSKGYYARVEDGRLYGRLCRLLVAPLLEAMATHHAHPVLEYLRAFRYPLAGEFAATAELAGHLRPPPGWGLEIATLGDAYAQAGRAGTAQVDLGRHQHDHRSVTGESGLERMSTEVAATLSQVLADYDLPLDHDRLRERFRETGDRLIEQYAADARFNGLEHSIADEREQLERYAGAIREPPADRRLPSWSATDLEPAAVLDVATPATATRSL